MHARHTRAPAVRTVRSVTQLHHSCVDGRGLCEKKLGVWCAFSCPCLDVFGGPSPISRPPVGRILKTQTPIESSQEVLSRSTIKKLLSIDNTVRNTVSFPGRSGAVCRPLNCCSTPTVCLTPGNNTCSCHSAVRCAPLEFGC